MEIEDYNAGWLSNFEVLQHLLEQKQKRDKVSAVIGRQVRMAENMQTIEFETIAHLQGDGHTISLHANRLDALMKYLKNWQLTKAEKLQLVNLLPSSEVEFYLIVEECEERFSSEQVLEILENIQKIIIS